MVDKFSKGTRSKIMSQVQRNSKPEQVLRKALFRLGYRYSLNHRFKELNFKPDIVMVSRRVCIFVDGCFWHGCPKCGHIPHTNSGFWETKIRRNKYRDRKNGRILREYGIQAIRFWEHDLSDNPKRCISRLKRLLHN